MDVVVTPRLSQIYATFSTQQRSMTISEVQGVAHSTTARPALTGRVRLAW
jgi:hypothetical protein